MRGVKTFNWSGLAEQCSQVSCKVSHQQTASVPETGNMQPMEPAAVRPLQTKCPTLRAGLFSQVLYQNLLTSPLLLVPSFEHQVANCSHEHSLK